MVPMVLLKAASIDVEEPGRFPWSSGGVGVRPRRRRPWLPWMQRVEPCRQPPIGKKSRNPAPNSKIHKLVPTFLHNREAYRRLALGRVASSSSRSNSASSPREQEAVRPCVRVA